MDPDKIVGVSTFDGTYAADGTATVVSTEQTITAPGFYVWSEQLDGVPGESDPTEPAPPRPSETTVHIDPKVLTQVSAQLVGPGVTITDTVEISGIVNSVGGKPVTNTVTGALYGPVEAVNGSCEDVDWTDAPVARPIDAFEVTADDQGKAVVEGVGEYTVPADAANGDCYTYAETLTVTVEPNDGAEPSKPVVVVHRPGQVTQTARVERFTPQATTVTSSQLATGEAVLTDTVMVSGGKPGAGFSGSTTLYGPFPTEADLALDPAKIVGVSTFDGIRPHNDVSTTLEVRFVTEGTWKTDGTLDVEDVTVPRQGGV